MVPSSLADRLARLTHLCTEISKIERGEYVATERLQDLLKEVSDLSKALEREITRRRRAND